jgi:hypothetical protein
VLTFSLSSLSQDQGEVRLTGSGERIVDNKNGRTILQLPPLPDISLAVVLVKVEHTLINGSVSYQKHQKL